MIQDLVTLKDQRGYLPAPMESVKVNYWTRLSGLSHVEL